MSNYIYHKYNVSYLWEDPATKSWSFWATFIADGTQLLSGWTWDAYNGFGPVFPDIYVSGSVTGVGYYQPMQDNLLQVTSITSRNNAPYGYNCQIYSKQINKNVPTQGSYIGDVIAADGTYPANGQHSDGYWYVKGALSFPRLSVNVGGVWKTASGGSVNIDGVWKNISDMWVNVDGVWKKS